MKILITGGTGFVGRHLLAYWHNSHHDITVMAREIDERLFGSRIHCLETDITVTEDIQAAIIFLRPDVVIHSAAMSKANDCELQKETCYAVNVAATEHIAQACKSIGARLIFLSTDFVFSNNGPYDEEDDCCPVNYYGESKMLAERAVQASGAAYAIIRTVLVYGKKMPGQNNTFLHRVKESLAANKTIELYTDQLRSPTYVNDLCTGIANIVETHFEGMVHICGEEIYTPYSLAQCVADYFGYSKSLLVPTTCSQRPEAARRPENAVLNIGKAKSILQYQPTNLLTALPAIFKGE